MGQNWLGSGPAGLQSHLYSGASLTVAPCCAAVQLVGAWNAQLRNWSSRNGQPSCLATFSMIHMLCVDFHANLNRL